MPFHSSDKTPLRGIGEPHFPNRGLVDSSKSRKIAARTVHSGRRRVEDNSHSGASKRPLEIFQMRLANIGRHCHIQSRRTSIEKVIFMADLANKYEINVGGKYYVDNQCIDCDLCRETAPDNFKRNEDGGYSYVYKQPESSEEEARCKEAKEGCPVEAIGDNGA